MQLPSRLAEDVGTPVSDRAQIGRLCCDSAHVTRSKQNMMTCYQPLLRNVMSSLDDAKC
jgi:hypothetical protein